MNVKLHKLEVETMAIDDVKVFTPTSYMDRRGHFMETYNKRDYFNAGLYDEFVQDNLSYSTNNVIRGLHYQLKHPQSKLVSAVRGEILDVAVDIRKNSSTFGEYVAVILSEWNKKRLYIPHGFAHGFIVRTEDAIVAYKCDKYRVAGDEYGIRWDDPKIGISWGLSGETPIMSEKDMALPLLSEAQVF